jgi:uncharacterized protein
MAAGTFLTARWRHLVMLNYAVEPRLLQPFVPAGTELDSWEGTTYASVVGFQFLDTRVLRVAIPFHRDFPEVNLRFYVRRRGPEGWRRGVVFIKEIVPRAAIALVARVLYGENYVAMPMRERADPEGSGVVEYGWRHGGRWGRVGARVSGAPSPLLEGSEAEFIAEHYWGYARQRGGGTVEYAVEHPRWNAWRAVDAALEADVAALYGPSFAEPLSAAPRSAFVADGSEVIVRRGVRI